MQPNVTQKGPVFGGAYVPYFYQSGRYLAYTLPATSGQGGPDSVSHATYDFSSIDRPWQELPRAQTVEQIITHGYLAIPRTDPETALISDKQHTSRLGLEDTISQVRNRYQIYEKNLYEIELAKCDTVNAFLTVQADRGFTPFDSRETYSLNKALQELYQQQRDERVSLWKDISRLKQFLPEAAQAYLGVYRKMEILNSKEDDDR